MKKILWWKDSDDERFWIYLASFIDADGCISIYRNKRTDAKDALIPYVSISNTNKFIIDSFIKTIPKKVYSSIGIQKRKPNHKTQYQLRIQNYKSVKYVLDKIKDYLLIKKENALLLIEFIKIREGKITKNNGYRHLGNEEYSLFNKIKKLNKTGVEV